MKSTTIYIGIDPGASGALGMISPEGARAKDMPIIVTEKSTKTKKGNKSFNRSIDKQSLLALLRPLAGGRYGDSKVHIFCELVGVMPGEGSVGAFNFGKGVGTIEGIIAALEIPVTYVRPMAWKKVMIAGKGGRDKNVSRERCQELFPEVDCKLKKHDGRAEAVLLAEFGRRQMEMPAAPAPAKRVPKKKR
jgi:crossover junction endodeoxyribonuclease RuvC